jgi:Flp pilus assembly protein TadB
MLTGAASKPPNTADSGELTGRAGSFVSRKIWLPKALYDAIPYFYILAGLAAFLATLYINTWLWILPQYLLFSAACLHIGILILRRRLRPRGRRQAAASDSD